MECEVQRHDVTVLQNCVHTKITSVMNDIVAHQARLDSVRLSLTQASDLAEKFCPIPDDLNKHWVHVHKLIKQLDEADETMEALNIESQKMKRRALLGLDTYIESASKGHGKRALANIHNTSEMVHGKKIKLETSILKKAPTLKTPPEPTTHEPDAAVTTPTTATYFMFTNVNDANAFSSPAAIGNGKENDDNAFSSPAAFGNGNVSSPEY
jgi:hypothetical protein